jgi:Ca2+-transporting ATPase
VSASTLTGNVLIFYDPRKEFGELLAEALEVLAAAPETGPAPAGVAFVPAGPFSFVKDLWAWLSEETRAAISGVKRPQASIAARPSRFQGAPVRPWHALDVSQVASLWETSPSNGLSSAGARQRLVEYGPNALPSYKQRSPLAIFAAQFHSLPVYLLLGSALVSIFTGGVGDAIVISVVVMLNASLGFATEAQAERTIARMLDLAEPFAAVIRDGAVVNVHGDEVVPGDLLVLTRGSQVVADARILEANWLTMDESALTGESMPVEKSLAHIPEEVAPLVARSNMVFRGTVVTGGSGLAFAVATGASTEIGNVQRLIAEAVRPQTPLERQLGNLGNQLVWVTGAVAASVLAVGLLRGFSFFQMANSAISLAVAAVPEGLPVVATTALASAVHAVLAQNVLVRRLDAIEALGAAQVVGLDKTGTLTLNRMAVHRVFAGMRRYLPGANGSLVNGDGPPSAGPELERFLEICVLCNEAGIELENGSWSVNGSPTESALIQMALQAGKDVQELRQRYPLLRTEVRTEHRNYMVTWHGAGANRTLIAVKGNPREVLDLCQFFAEDGRISSLTKHQRKTIEAENRRMADSALRVLGVACGESAPDGLNAPSGLTWLGLAGMADPLREDLPQFIQALRAAGIRPLMITGDQTATAQAVARSLGLNNEFPVRVMDAASLERLTPAELADAITGPDIFSRVTPSHKLQIVQALQKHGLVVAMTGDGVNDGPALRAADIGITLGKSGTQVAREVADIVLRDDNIHTLIPAIRDGRRIYDNIRRATHYISATNMSEVSLMFLSLALGMGQPLTARQLLWINVFTDVFPELAMATQAAEGDLMRRPPQDPNAAIVSKADLPRLGRQCGIITAASFGCYAWGVARYGIGAQASTVAFLGLATAQLLHAISARSETQSMFERGNLPPNRFLAASVWGALGGVIGAQFVPGLRGLLGTAAVGFMDLLVCAGFGGGSLLVNELWKHAGPVGAQKALPVPAEGSLQPVANAA